MSERAANEVDDESTANEGEDGPETVGGLDTPGGGPDRVVSDTSVDDILQSLDGGEDGESGPDDDADAPATGGAVSASRSSADAVEAPASTATEPDAGSGSSTATDDAPSGGDGDLDAPSGTAAEDADETASADEAASSDEERSSDAAEDDLAARVETGEITGADVRAAEAGEEREETPEIDEIELSMDDVEVGTTVSTSPSSDDGDGVVGSTAGPLADADDATADSPDSAPDRDADDGDGDSDDEDAGGFLGRIRGLFLR